MDGMVPIFLNTKRDSIALYPLNRRTYIKEIYEGYDLSGPLRSTKTVEAPWNRDGIIFEDVTVYFQYLIANAACNGHDCQAVLAD